MLLCGSLSATAVFARRAEKAIKLASPSHLPSHTRTTLSVSGQCSSGSSALQFLSIPLFMVVVVVVVIPSQINNCSYLIWRVARSGRGNMANCSLFSLLATAAASFLFFIGIFADNDRRCALVLSINKHHSKN